jgi:DNA-binding CsgD family transcriptional regulator
MRRDDLTQRELDTLRLIAAGHSRADAGRLLGNTANTVKSRMNIVLHKLGASTTANAVSVAHQRGLL